MAFDKSGWAFDGANYNSGITRTHRYTTSDAAAAVDTAGYFNDVADYVSADDTIFAVCNGVAVTYTVLSNSGGVVDVSDGDAASTTDTD